MAARLWEQDKQQFLAALSVGYLQHVFVARNVSVTLDAPGDAFALLRRTVLSPAGLNKMKDLGRRTSQTVLNSGHRSRTSSLNEPHNTSFAATSVVITPVVPDEAPFASSFCAPIDKDSSAQVSLFTPTGRWKVFPLNGGVGEDDEANSIPAAAAVLTESKAMSTAAQLQYLTPALQRLMSNDFAPKPLQQRPTTSLPPSPASKTQPQQEHQEQQEARISVQTQSTKPTPLFRKLSNRLDAFRNSTNNNRLLESSTSRQGSPHHALPPSPPVRSIATAPVPTMLHFRNAPTQLCRLTDALVDVTVLYRFVCREKRREVNMQKQRQSTSAPPPLAEGSQVFVQHLPTGVAETLQLHTTWLTSAMFHSMIVFLDSEEKEESFHDTKSTTTAKQRRPSREELVSGGQRLYEHVLSILISSFRVLEFAVLGVHAATAVNAFASKPSWNFGSSTSFGADELFPIVVQVCQGLPTESRAFLRATLRWMECSTLRKHTLCSARRIKE